MKPLRALIRWLSPPAVRRIRAQIDASRNERLAAGKHAERRRRDQTRESARLRLVEKRFAVLARVGVPDAETEAA